MKNIGVAISLFTVIALSGFLLFTSTVNGDGSSPEKKCLIMVSGSEDYSQTELDKASSFREYMLEELDEQDIEYLTDTDDPNSDGPANQSNIESAFDWLENVCDPSTEVIVYISDHIIAVNNNNTFIFDDCNITTSTMDGWLDEVEHSEMTIILNGERSGLGAPDLSNSDNNVICSMKSYQEYDPDLFNITISLEDSSLDKDGNGKISFIEAYWGEVSRLQYSDQSPVLYDN